MPLHQSFLSFNGGETSPYLRYRIDLAGHGTGSAAMENFLPMPFGGFRKRPGTLLAATLAAATRIEPFHYSTSVRYVLAFTEEDLKIYLPDGTLAFTLAASFSDPFALQFAQVNDVLFIVDPGNAPRQLSRFADDNWTLAEVPYTYPPLLDENADEDWELTTDFDDGSGGPYDAWVSGHYYAVGARVSNDGSNYVAIATNIGSTNNEPGSGVSWQAAWSENFADHSAAIGQSIALTSSKDLFDAGHVGAYFEISRERAADNYEVEIAATSANDGLHSSVLVIQGKWTFSTFGTWKGTFVLERSKDRGVTWEDLRQYESDGDRNVAAEGEEDARVLMRVRWEYDAAGSSKPRGVLGSSEAFIRGIVKITAVTDAQTVTAVAVTPVEKCTTEYWTEGAFSTFQGFPKAISVHERRLVFGGTTRKAVSIWLSKSDDLLNFHRDTASDGSIYVTLASQRQDPICWITSQRRLLVGTTGGEWVFGSDSNDDPITPAGLLVRENTRFGSASLAALPMGDAVYFLERQRRRVREFAYQLDQQNYAAADLSRLAEHITASGIVQMAWQQNREPFLWAVRADGVLLAFAYNRDEKIAAWSRHTTRDGLFRSVAVLRNESGDDNVFLVVERDGTFYLEAFAAGQQEIQESGDLAACHYVDSGVTGPTVGDEHEVSGLDHLDGQFVVALADGIVHTGLVPSGGVITLPAAAAEVHVGLPIASNLETLPIEIQTDTGATLARLKRPHELILSLFQSRGGTIVGNGSGQLITYTGTGDLTDSPPDLATGWIPQTLSPGFETDLVFGITHAEPYPFTVRAAVLNWQIYEP